MPKTVSAFLPGADQLGGTLAIEIYPQAPGTILNGAGGDALTEIEEQPGWYAATVAEDIAAIRLAVITLDGVAIGGALIDMDQAAPVYGGVTLTTADADRIATLITAAAGGLTGGVTVPRVARGRKLRLIVGDDYLEAIGRAIPWDLDQAGDLPDFSTGWTVAMHVLPVLPGSTPVTFTGSIETGDGSNRTGLLEAEAADTALLRTGEAMWQLEFTETSSSRKTVLLDGQATIERRAGT